MTQNYNHIPTPSFKGKVYLSDVYGINFLKELNIGYVISLFPVLENQTIPESIKHDEVKISDRSDVETILKMNSILNNISLKIAHNLSNNINVLVHCFAGKSRSASVIIGYLMKYHNMRFEEAYTYVKHIRPSIDPNIGFYCQLQMKF
jgi:atypical dual specificity phosphatase